MPKTAKSKNKTDEIPVSAPPADAPQVEPSTEAIAQRAYEIFLERGGTHGNDSDDWLQAELELRAKTR
jgi:hypothetical protein